MFQSLMSWRIGMACVVYGILYLGYKEYAPWWLLAFAVPFLVLFRPPDERDPEYCKHLEKTLNDGFPFYLFKWGGSFVLLLLGITLYFSYQAGFSFVKIAPQLVQNTFVLVPIILTVVVSWSVTKRHYRELCVAPGKKKVGGTGNQGKKKGNKKRKRKK